MKWLLLLLVTVAGLNAVRPGEPVADIQIAKACGVDPVCIRRYATARRDALGEQWSEEPTRFLFWTTPCPPAASIAFRACNP